MFLFWLLDVFISFPNFNLFVSCRGKLLTTTETTATWTWRITWFLTWLHDPFKNPDPFLHWHTVIFIGHGWRGSLRLELSALKCQNPIFFSEYLFTHYRATITIKNPIGRTYRHYSLYLSSSPGENGCFHTQIFKIENAEKCIEQALYKIIQKKEQERAVKELMCYKDEFKVE